MDTLSSPASGSHFILQADRCRSLRFQADGSLVRAAYWSSRVAVVTVGVGVHVYVRVHVRVNLRLCVYASMHVGKYVYMHAHVCT